MSIFDLRNVVGADGSVKGPSLTTHLDAHSMAAFASAVAAIAGALEPVVSALQQTHVYQPSLGQNLPGADEMYTAASGARDNVAQLALQLQDQFEALRLTVLMSASSAQDADEGNRKALSAVLQKLYGGDGVTAPVTTASSTSAPSSTSSPASGPTVAID